MKPTSMNVTLPNGKSVKLLGLLETAAAISDGVHCNKEAYFKLHETIKDAVSGFPGIWILCAECALELDTRHNLKEDDYIENCDSVALEILDLTQPDTAENIVTRALQRKDV